MGWMALVFLSLEDKAKTYGYFRSEQLTDMGCGKHSLGEEQ
jgi:hypothetical protein